MKITSDNICETDPAEVSEFSILESQEQARREQRKRQSAYKAHAEAPQPDAQEQGGITRMKNGLKR